MSSGEGACIVYCCLCLGDRRKEEKLKEVIQLLGRFKSVVLAKRSFQILRGHGSGGSSWDVHVGAHVEGRDCFHKAWLFEGLFWCSLRGQARKCKSLF